MRIRQSSLAQVLSTADVVDVISEFVPLKKRGRNYLANCPFHNEKSPSFNVSQEKGIYKCFGCGKHGDSVTFLQELEGLTFVQAVEYLAKKYAITLEYEQGQGAEDEAESRRKEGLMVLLAFAADFYKKQLNDTVEGKAIAQSYLRERGVSPATATSFALGWAPDAWDGLSKEAIKAGYTPQALEDAGLATQREDGSLTDRFRARVMFPIYTAAGRIVGFGGRILKKDDKTAKYINSPESEVYNKSKILYGLYQSRQDIRKADHVYLTEGYLDVIAMHQAGLPRAVASSGTSLTEDQARLLCRYTENVTVLFDGDAAGQKAALRGIDILLEQGMAVRVLTLPDGHDPDSYLKAHGLDAFIAYAATHEQDLVTWKVAALAKEAGADPFKRAEVISEVARTISLVEDAVRRAVLFKTAAGLLEMDEQLLVAEANRAAKVRANQKDKERERAARRTDSQLPIRTGSDFPALSADDAPSDDIDHYADPSSTWEKEHVDPLLEIPIATPEQQLAMLERETLRLLLNWGLLGMPEDPATRQLYDYVLAELDDIDFSSPIERQMLAYYRELTATHQEPKPSLFLQHPDVAIRQYAQELVSIENTISPGWAKKGVLINEVGPLLSKTAFHHLLRLKRRVLTVRVRDAENLLKTATGQPDETDTARRYMDAKRWEAAISKELGEVILS